MSVLRKEMEKYRDIDEDELLKKLSEEELQRLEDELEELDPDNALLPAGMRQKDQTKKAPTGTFQRDNLLAHLEKQAKEHPDKEDLVPFTGEKRGKAWVPKKRVDPIMENVTLEPELEEALASATDAELCDIAALLPSSLHPSPSSLHQSLHLLHPCWITLFANSTPSRVSVDCTRCLHGTILVLLSCPCCLLVLSRHLAKTLQLVSVPQIITCLYCTCITQGLSMILCDGWQKTLNIFVLNMNENIHFIKSNQDVSLHVSHTAVKVTVHPKIKLYIIPLTCGVFLISLLFGLRCCVLEILAVEMSALSQMESEKLNSNVSLQKS